jgi:hypothetical protein
VNIGGASANDVTISGSTTITSFGAGSAGTHRVLTFAGILTLTHNATSLILPGGANIVTAAGDVADFVSLGGNNWRCEYYTKANGQSISGSPDNTKLPLTGGTMTGAINEANFVSLPAAATTDLGAANSNNVQINAGSTITSFGNAAAGTRRALVFNTSVLITHNASTLILPGGASITAVAGDIAEFVSIGAGGWRCEYYTKADGTAIVQGTSSDPTKLPLAGGTMSGAINYAPAVIVAASSTPNIAGAVSNCVSISGATVINGFTSGTDGTVRYVTFGGACTLVPAGSFILPGSGNITTANGDVAAFQCQGTTTWKCLWYQRKDGTALVATPASDPTKLPLAGGTMTGAINEATSVDVASASSPNIGAAAANTVRITGSTNITSFSGGANGMRRLLFFAGAPLLTNSASLVLPTGANIQTAVGDFAEFYYHLASNAWYCASYTRASGQPLAGGGSPYSTIQVFNGSITDLAMRVKNVAESVFVQSGSPGAALNFDVSSGAVQYWTGTNTTNWNWNIRHSSGTALNTAMAMGDSVTVVLLVNNGATAYMPATILIDGSAQTVKWQGGTAPTSGNTSSTDAWSMTIIKTASATYQVLGAVTQYK